MEVVEKLAIIYNAIKFDGVSSSDFKTEETYHVFNEFLDLLEANKVRAVDVNGLDVTVNPDVKKCILVGFYIGDLVSQGDKFFDKNTYPERIFTEEDGVRVVPGGTSVRRGAYISKGVTIMPPVYANVGFQADRSEMLDSFSLGGSCAYLGPNAHLAMFAGLGGVLSPVEATPCVAMENSFIGAYASIVEGTILEPGVKLAMGTRIGKSTRVWDAIEERYLGMKEDKDKLVRDKDKDGAIIPHRIPTNNLVVPGIRPEGKPIYCAWIVSHDAKNVTLEEALKNL